MPKAKNKKNAFIDKKNSTSFHLVHRSQKDPLAADDTAPQMVLAAKLKDEERDKIKEEEREFGVFYDDNYNYLQHLKDRNVVEHDWTEADRFILEGKKDVPAAKHQLGPKLVLPSTVFATEGEEEEVGLLNRAARTTGLDLSLDPDIVAAMDDAKPVGEGEEEDEMEDDFVAQLMGDGEDGEWEDESEEEGSDMDSDFGGGRSEDEEDDEVGSMKSWGEEETATKFTNYSMSSSCIRRNAQLTLVDDKFERFFDEYNDGEEGALEGEEIEGALGEDDKRMEELLRIHQHDKETAQQQYQRGKEVSMNTLLEGEDMEEVVLPMGASEARREQWDAETILTTYSTLYNHPKLISEPKKPSRIVLSTKTGIPKDTLGRGLTAAALKQLDLESREQDEDAMTIRTRITELSIRPKHETKEEKKSRKAEVKELRKERRVEKKANTQAFKSEKSRQEKVNINVRNNFQGVKIF